MCCYRTVERPSCPYKVQTARHTAGRAEEERSRANTELLPDAGAAWRPGAARGMRAHQLATRGLLYSLPSLCAPCSCHRINQLRWLRKEPIGECGVASSALIGRSVLQLAVLHSPDQPARPLPHPACSRALDLPAEAWGRIAKELDTPQEK